MRETILLLLPFVLPPLLGAIIGYVTNAIAIKMLFRPLTEKRILGIKIPFTPGIIPRQRYQLSQSIARMVSTKLLTEETIRDKLADPRLRENLYESVGRFTHDILHRVPADRSASETEAVAGLEQISQSLLSGFFSSDAFRGAARSIVAAALRGVLGVTVDRLSPSAEWIRDTVGRALGAAAQGEIASSIEQAVERWAAGHLESNTPFAGIVGKETITRAGDLLEKGYEPVLQALLAYLRSGKTRHELALHGRDLLKQILQRLNLFQRFLVSATQYDRSLNDAMPAIIGDVLDTIERAGSKPHNRDEILTAVRGRLSRLGETGVATLGSSLGIDVAAAVRKAVRAALDIVARPDVHDRIATSLSGFLARNGERTIAELLVDLRSDQESLLGWADRLVDSWLARPDSGEKLTGAVLSIAGDFLRSERRRPLATLLSLSTEQKGVIDGFITDRLVEQVDRRVPELLAGLDIHGMVVAKIDGLDIESVEKLLLMVIARHLKWINLFGAILGALIGGLQIVASRLLP